MNYDKDVLEEIQKLTNKKVVFVHDGIITLLDGTILDPLNFIYQKAPNDGFYKLLTCTCNSDSGCEIGKPPQRCINNKCYSKSKCAVYDAWKITTLDVPFDMLYDLLLTKKTSNN